MIRSLNYTNRKKINREHIRLRLEKPKGQPLTFSADLELQAYKLPEHAKVYVEAYRNTYGGAVYMRFPYGTAKSLVPPADRSLTEFGGTEAVLFRVKVVDETATAKLVAEADQLHASAPEEKDQSKLPLLYIKPEKLGDQIWKLDLTQDMPTVLINSEITDVHATARSPLFTALVYPAVIRQVLTQVLVIDENSDIEGEGWQSKWLRFCLSLPLVPPVPEPGIENQAEIFSWIDDVAGSFCTIQNTKVSFMESQEAK
jgi:hypothetical protein